MNDAEKLEHVRLVFEAYQLGRQDGWDAGLREGQRRGIEIGKRRRAPVKHHFSIQQSIPLAKLRQLHTQETTRHE